MSAPVLDPTERKKSVRKRAFSARKAAKSDAANIAATAHLNDYLKANASAKVIAGYMAIQTEIDPYVSMATMHKLGRAICLPVIPGHAMPLLFREWTPDCAMIEGDFGALIPRGGRELTPDLAIVPLVGFDMFGHRLGYGGGFYDRTLAILRKNRKFKAVGFAFAGQELTDIPTDKYDQALDAIITENGVLTMP